MAANSPNLLGSFEGYPTCFSHNLGTWEELCDGLCAIELSLPPIISLKDNKGEVFHKIGLQNSFDFVKQHDQAVLLTTSNQKSADMYGFAFADVDKREAFEIGLSELKQYSTSMSSDDKGFETQAIDLVDKKPDVKKRPPIAPRPSFDTSFDESKAAEEYVKEAAFCKELSKFIEAGDVAKAQEIVLELSKLKSKLIATPDIQPLTIEVSIKVESIGKYETPPIKVFVEPEEMTVKDLKIMMYQDYQFPPSIQRFIIKQRIPRDDELLSKCGVKETEMLYLYLKAIDFEPILSDQKIESKAVQTERVVLPRVIDKQQQNVFEPRFMNIPRQVFDNSMQNNLNNNLARFQNPQQFFGNNQNTPMFQQQNFQHHQGFQTHQGIPQQPHPRINNFFKTYQPNDQIGNF